MNVEEVRNIVLDRFPDVAEFEPSVLKAHATHEGSPFALWIFDCSQSISRDEFDLRAYQSKLLQSDFHRTPGSLQWNLYCYFLCDEDDFAQIHDRGLVDVVERDHEYARKFVRTPAMLRNELASIAAISADVKSKLPTDVGSIWQFKLAQHGLDLVYSNLSYAETIRRIKSGENIDMPYFYDDSPVTSEEAVPIEAIKSIDLGNFRQRPRQRFFEFGNCNLIYGANGSGKTSLLEAIEAWMCGKHRRNPDADLGLDCMRLKIKGADEWLPGPSSNKALYRKRDHLWFGNYQVRKNDLCFNFAKFCFYDSDAAARLEISEDDREIQDALSRLVLGEAATMLAERISKLLPTFKREERSYSKEIATLMELIQDANDSISALEQPTDLRKKTYEHLINHLKTTRWRGEPPEDSANACLQLLENLNKISANIEYILEELNWLQKPSSKIINAQLEFFSASNMQIDALIAKDTKAKQEKAVFDQQVLSLIESEKLCDRWIEYVESGAEHLPDMITDYEDAKKKKRGLLSAKAELAQINLQQYAEIDESATAMSARVKANLNQKNNLCAKANAAVASLEEVHGKIEGLLSEIRARATKLFEIDVDAVICPVCGAQYRNGELNELVQHQASHDAVPELQEAHAELRRLKEDQKNLNRALRDLETLKGLGSGITESSIGIDPPLKTLVKPLMMIENAISQCDIDLDKLKRNLILLGETGFTEQELERILEQIDSLFPDISPITKELAIQKRKALQQALESIRYRQKELENLIESVEQQKHAILMQHLSPSNVSLNIFKKCLSQLAASKERIDYLNNYIVVENDQSLSDLSVQLFSLQKACESFIRLQQKDESVQSVINQNQAKIQAAKKSLESELPVYERLKNAVAVLEEITREHGIEKYVKTFFSENLEQISDLFCVMHTPRDFHKVVWEPENPMAIRVVRKSDSAIYPVSKLSSGQRNALSLAIFLTINRKISSAPSLILLDDPVAFVDDLNIISFFDCLREMLSGCDRQVFFATASTKTANLFAKKFDYLGKDKFRSFQLAP